MKIPLSIVIITLNEEKNLPGLLGALEKQTYQPREIIVSDGGSTDGTVEVARDHGCQIVDGGDNPAISRNNGASYAAQPYLLFLDADVLPDNEHLLENMLSETTSKGYDAATCDNIPICNHLPEQEQKIIRWAYAGYNCYQRLSQYISPVCTGTFILSKKNAFELVNGFNETLPFGEDSDFSLQIHKKGLRFRVLNEAKIRISIRRFEQVGIAKGIGKPIFYNTKRMFSGARGFKAEYPFDIYGS